jgi:hypothetical protein
VGSGVVAPGRAPWRAATGAACAWPRAAARSAWGDAPLALRGRACAPSSRGRAAVRAASGAGCIVGRSARCRSDRSSRRRQARRALQQEERRHAMCARMLRATARGHASWMRGWHDATTIASRARFFPEGLLNFHQVVEQGVTCTHGDEEGCQEERQEDGEEGGEEDDQEDDAQEVSASWKSPPPPSSHFLARWGRVLRGRAERGPRGVSTEPAVGRLPLLPPRRHARMHDARAATWPHARCSDAVRHRPGRWCPS